ncbi:coiled-coil domain-containing protein 60 isoform X1 [Astyanax mexicanus]|uniref:coiled-coil domain-containing protein 60 isoform X1 n=1 Tax=Astyanax mexicanus TaxID=7994 RepID=UPI0020CAEDC8|nr:coiled-coil domain-containing protein 60 isoform X1 [Astyanax mexicanus]
MNTPITARRCIRPAPPRKPVLQHRVNWERVYWESLGRSQRDQSRLGYRTEQALRGEIREGEGGGRSHVIPAGTSRGSKNSSQTFLKTNTDSDSFQKLLFQSRKVVLLVKQGCSYFQLLQDQEFEEEEKRERRRREERRTIQPPSGSALSNRRGAGVNAVGGSSWRRVQSSRPFTPIHRSLTSHQPLDLPQECLYGQLCCLYWLLDALTLEHPGRIGPVTSCWDRKDPGGSRNALKVLNKEKVIQAKWEQFISSPKSLRPVLRVSRIGSARPKSSSVSVGPSMAVTSSLSSSLSSSTLDIKDSGDVTVSAEQGGPQSRAGPETDPPLSEYLQKLLEEVQRAVSTEPFGSETENRPETDRGEVVGGRRSERSVSGKLETQRSESSRPSLSCRTAEVLEEIRMAFDVRVQELDLSLTDALEHSAKRRWSSAVQRYRFLSDVSSYRSFTSSAQSRTFKPRVPQSTGTNGTTGTTDTDPNRPYSTQWLLELLRALPPHTHSDRKLSLVLEKLRRFTAEPTLRIRPYVFLRVLNSLQPWELCCPHLTVAVEMVRRYAVGMSEEEYDDWLCGRVHLP